MTLKQIKMMKNDEKVKLQVSRVCTYFAVIMPLTTLPQLIKLYTSHNAGGLSLLMWILYTIGVVPFLLFGITHDVKQLVVLNTLWLFVNVLMISGIMMYS